MDAESLLLAPSPEHLAAVEVFPLIPALRKDIDKTIDSALSWDQLTASDVDFAIVRPIVTKYARLKNLAIMYACLVVRSYYQNQSDLDLAYASVMLTRAMFCEILAMKLLTHFASNDMQLVAVLTTCWNPLAGAPPDILQEVRLALGGGDDDLDYPQSALEMAISTSAKSFISAPLCQKVINQIYSGDVVFSSATTRSILADNYKPRSIQLYVPDAAPFLDHYRLRVPKYGVILEFLNFTVLLLTFILCQSNRDVNKITPWEFIFIVFAAAFTLDEYTVANEQGWIIYVANMWNVFDFSFIIIYLAYLVLRLRGLSNDNVAMSDMAFDTLACGACILFPRLAFFALSNNVVVLSLRAMIAQFFSFIVIAAISFSGLLFALWTLAQNDEEAHRRWDVGSIVWLMVQIWFGNTSLSFAQASSFHPIFGPILMTGFAALSNTLLVTIMISTLSNTAAEISDNAPQEHLFQFAIKTIERVKSDALFSYQPPFNILAFLLLKPASWVLSPRALHSFNVFLIRLTSLPILVVIRTYECYLVDGRFLRETGKDAAYSLLNRLPRRLKTLPLVEALVGSTASDLYDAIFDVEYTQEPGFFQDSDDEQPPRLQPQAGSPPPKIRRDFPSPERSTSAGRVTAPRLRVQSTVTIPEAPGSEAFARGRGKSPLAKLFANKSSMEVHLPEASMKKVEALMDEIRDLPVQRFNDEMRELQERQARIEDLLLALTRGLRNEKLPSPQS